MPISIRHTVALNIALFIVLSAHAQTYSWTGGDGFWDEAENWQPDSPSLPDIPNFLAIADISHNDNIDRQITFRRGLTGNNPVYFLRYLMLGNSGSGETTLKMSEYDGVIPGVAEVLGIDPHELTTTRLWVGNNGDGVVDMTGGTLNVTQGLVIGLANNSPIANTGTAAFHGEFRMSGGDLRLFVEGQPAQSLIDISADASGSFIQTGGHVHALDNTTTARIRIGLNPYQVVTDGPVGRYDLRDGILEASNLEIGIGHRGEFIQSGGLNRTFDLRVGDGRGWEGDRAKGYYELSGGQLETIGNSTVVNTDGEFLMLGGDHLTQSLVVDGEYRMTAGSLELDSSSSGFLRVSGDFLQQGGTVDLANNRDIALEILDGGLYNLTGGSLGGGALEIGGSFLHTGGSLDIGGQDLRVTPTGGWTWLGGNVNGVANRVVIDGLAAMSGPSGLLLDIDIGEAENSQGHFTISGASDLLAGTIDLGIAGKGTLDVQTSGTVSMLNLNVGQVQGSQGIAIVNSGKLDTAALRVGEFGIGRVDLRGGELEATVSLDIHDGGEFLQSGGTATTSVANLHGTTEITGGFFNSSNRINVAQDASLTLTGDFTLQTNPPETPTSGSMSTPELNLDGGMISARRFIAESGTLTITGDNNRITAETHLNGTTITNNGILEFDGTTYFNGAVIDGTGSLVNRGDMITGFTNFDQALTNNGNLVLNSGTVTDSVMLFMNQTFTQSGSGKLVMSALDPISFTTYDSITFGAHANLAGTLELVLEDGFNAVEGTTLTLLNFAADFSPESGLTPRVSGAFDQLILPDLSGGLNWDTSQLNTMGALSIVASPVPEPASAALLLSGIVTGFVILRRRPRTVSS